MALTEKNTFYSEKEYLEFERNSESRNELLDGEIYAMTGASLKHNLISLSVASSIRAFLKGKNCKVFMADMRVKISKNLYTYPDILIVCGEIQFSDDHLDTIQNPKCIIEILSDSTEKYDRGRKFLNYQKLDSLEEYILVSQNEFLVEKFLKKEKSSWDYSILENPVDSLFIQSIDFSLPLSEIYEGAMIETPKPENS